MKNFFFGRTRKIAFSYNTKTYEFCNISTNIYPSTIVKLVAGVNHFLMYYWIYDREEYYKLCNHIFSIFIELRNANNEIISRGENIIEHQVPLVKKYCVLNDDLIDWICRYTHAILINDIDKKESSTKVTLDNIDCAILSATATAIKIAFIISGSLLVSLKFDESIDYFKDELVDRILNKSYQYFDMRDEESGDLMTPKDIHSHIDQFVYGRIDTLWDKNTTPSFRNKFEEVGKNILYHQSKNVISVYSSLKQYFPQLLNESLKGKYSTDPNTKISDIYWDTTRDFEDFKFINKNLAAYLQKTLEEITKRQDTRATIVNVNIPEFLTDSSDERSIRKDIALYEDKTRHLFDLRKSKIESFYKLFVDEILRFMKSERIEPSKVIDILKTIKMGKEHSFNNFILDKILLCLTGEALIYKKVLGNFAKILLFLFYLKVKYTDDLDWLAKKIDIMIMNPISSIDENLDNVTQYLIKEGYNEKINSKTFALLARIYKDPRTGFQIKLKLENMLDVYDFMSDPSVVRNLLFPKLYKLENPENNINKYHTTYKTFDEEKTTKDLFNYINDIR